MNFTNKLKGKPITVKSFLSLQESVTNTRKLVTAIESLKDSLKLTTLSFEPSSEVQNMLSQSHTFGSLVKPTVKSDVDVSIADIKLPFFTKSSTGAVGITIQQGRPVSATQSSAGARGTKQQSRPVAVTQSSAGAVGTTKQQGRPVLATQQASLGQMKAT